MLSFNKLHLLDWNSAVTDKCINSVFQGIESSDKNLKMDSLYWYLISTL